MDIEQKEQKINIIVKEKSHLNDGNKTTVFVLAGKPRIGKDSFVNFVKSYYPNTINFSSIDYIRWVSEKYFNLDCKNKNNKYRKFLSTLKQALIEYNDFPFEESVSVINDKHEDELLFLHIREKNEILKLKKVFPEVGVVYIDFYETNEDEDYNNPSDDEVGNVKDIADVVISYIGGLEDLNKISKEFVERFVLK